MTRWLIDCCNNIRSTSVWMWRMTFKLFVVFQEVGAGRKLLFSICGKFLTLKLLVAMYNRKYKRNSAANSPYSIRELWVSGFKFVGGLVRKLSVDWTFWNMDKLLCSPSWGVMSEWQSSVNLVTVTQVSFFVFCGRKSRGVSFHCDGQ